MPKRKPNPAAGLEAEVRAAVEAALRENPIGPDVIARAARLAKAGRQDTAFGVLASAVRARLSSDLRAKLDRSIFKASHDTAKRRARETGVRYDAPYLRRRIRSWARRRTGDLITVIGDGQKEAFRRCYAARVSQARAHAEGRTGRKAAGAVLGVRERMKDIARHGFGLTAPQSRRMAREIAGGASQDELAKLHRRMVRRRSEVIARTEASTAVNGASVETWKTLGLAKKGYRKRWILTADDRLCPICEPLDGTTATIGGAFPGGIGDPPAHPQCRCTVGIVKPGTKRADKQIEPGTEGRPDRREVKRPEPGTRPKPKPKPKPEPKDGRDRAARMKGYRDGAIERGRNWRKKDATLRKLRAAARAEMREYDRLFWGTKDLDKRRTYRKLWSKAQDDRDAADADILKESRKYRAGMVDFLRPDGAVRDFTGEIRTPKTGKLLNSPKTDLVNSIGLFRRMVSPNLDIGHNIKMKTITTNRPWAYWSRLPRDTGEVALNAEVNGPASVIHELTHHLEYANPGLNRSSYVFLKSRIGRDEEPVLKDPQATWSVKAEKWFKDKFAERNKDIYGSDWSTPYPGRWYGGWDRGEGRAGVDEDRGLATEIATMGMQGVYEDGGRFAEQDPDYFDWVVENIIRYGMD